MITCVSLSTLVEGARDGRTCLERWRKNSKCFNGVKVLVLANF